QMVLLSQWVHVGCLLRNAQIPAPTPLSVFPVTALFSTMTVAPSLYMPPPFPPLRVLLLFFTTLRIKCTIASDHANTPAAAKSVELSEISQSIISTTDLATINPPP